MISGEEEPEPYGIIVGTCVIRDLEGLGFEHVGSRGQEIVKAVVGISSDNYPGKLRSYI